MKVASRGNLWEVIAAAVTIVSIVWYGTAVSAGGRTGIERTGGGDAGFIMINGAGATFPFPLLSTLTFEYGRIKPYVRLNYQSIGSGGGIRQHSEKTVDFAASDAPLNEKQRINAPGTLHIPVTIGSIVLAYNLPGVSKGIRLTGPLVADIFLGKVKMWNDPAIRNLNPEFQLPEREMLVVHRSDGSGTSFVWTGYLSAVSSDWRVKVGQGTAVQWPTGIGASGNEGVTGLIRSTEYAIGYVELAYALQNKMTYAFLQNREGRFVEPSLESTSAAAAALASALPGGERSWEYVSLINAPGDESYPVVTFSYLLIYRDLSTLPSMNVAKAKELVEFLKWAIREGQGYARRLQYVPLPQAVVSLNEETISSINYKGEQLAIQVAR